jgi:signal transduction histidine kinase
MVRLFSEHVAAALALCRGADIASTAAPAHALAEYAHEVRGHLHTALGYLSLAQRDPDPESAELLDEARLAVQRAVDLADRTLDDVAEERKSLVSLPVSRPTDLLELLRECVIRAEPAARLHRLSLELAGHSGPCLVAARAPSMERLLDNLILNAIEHSPEGSSVSVRVENQGDRVVVSVEDVGSGIPEGDLEKIFTPFYRSSSSRRTRSGGLGLSLARRWATQAGGRLWAENRAAGGARFILQLPLQGASLALTGRNHVSSSRDG